MENIRNYSKAGQIYTLQGVPIDAYIGPWKSFDEFKQFLLSKKLDENSLVEGSKIRIVENNNYKELVYINGVWKEFKNSESSSSGISISIEDDEYIEVGNYSDCNLKIIF